jgi:outer membrane lipoprotein-sorting protein
MTEITAARFFTRCFPIGAALVVLLFCGCHTTRKAMKNAEKMSRTAVKAPVTEKMTPEAIKEGLNENTIRYSTFSARAKLDITTGGNSQKGIATFIRMKKDSAIWISIRPVFGIELVRVLITPDSVKMINFFKKTITLRSADSMQQMLDIPYDFSSLQNLIVGNPLFLTDSLEGIRLDSTGQTIAFSCRKGNFISRYLLGAADYLLRQYQIRDSGRSAPSRYSVEQFEDYKFIGNRHFAAGRHLVIHTGSETEADVKFNRVEFDKPINFPFPMVDKFTLK